ncbi:hypothetical protein FB192DRAFT_1279569 [Mucor lusitanicus]|uniref:PIPK domain-containing protein n=1 Tax=Mucor circinelloides f. lusitanicus TaxID=29924 RepID=A0A8H4BJQ5_MUCCL|nr:hypothetical protein FB192DRAFT_1279569 [Mucor lusitanicus]
MLYVNAPKDSKFLANVMHGAPIHDGEHTMHFPVGGTIRMYGLNANDEAFTKTLIELVQSLVYLTYSLYLETYVMRDSHVKSVISTTTAPSTPNAATAAESNQADSAPKLGSHHAKKTTDATGFKKLQQAAAATTTLDALPFDMDAINEGDPHRFCKLKKRIEFALISSSPECHFPYPNLLNRLEAEEDMMMEQKRLLMLQQEESIPTRNGLEHLLLDTTSLHSFKQHQSITIGFTCYPIGCPDRPCLGPLMSKIDYFRYESPVDSTTALFPSIDQSLGHTIRHWCNQSHKFHGCQQPLIDHIFSFTHGHDKDKIVTWLACSVCDASTTPLLLSSEAAAFSFAKYLELLFYSSKLAAPESFCAHTASKYAANNTKSTINRCFMYNGIVFKFTYEDAKYYELRAPRIQIAPETLVSDRLTFVAPRVGVSTLLEWKHKSAERDVDLFFQSIRAHLDLLNHYTIAESRRKTRSLGTETSTAKQQLQSELRALDLEIRGLSKRLDADHQAMLYALADTSLNELNDFRRYFAIQSESIIQYLTDWQQLKCDEVTDACGWDSPDYISQKTVHCFPGSSVLVREDEPTSIIAYSLSSNDYIQEILHDEGTAYHDMEPPPPLPTNASKKKLPQLPNIIDGYYSSIERKYISPSTGATSETASFRTMITEVVKSSVVEVSISNSKRLEDLKARLSPWTRKQEETKLENAYEASLVYFTCSHGMPCIEFVHEGIEFTCIIYYAKEFEMLRRQCNINQLMIESLCRCQTWTASGGKSKSHFYKTQGSEMMNAWNVAEKDAFLKFAPKYFDHVGKSANEPSVLAKIFGFFTIRMKNAADKKSILNLDVLVMEHLFFNQSIIKRFDFKGIQDRHVDEFRKQQSDTTLWDGDWLNGNTEQGARQPRSAYIDCT